MIGVLTFVTQGDGGNVQGFNFIIPSAAVRQFLDGTTVALDEPSRFNTAWHAGLRAYFNGQYSRATPHLVEANRLLPDVPDVRRLGVDNATRATTQPLLPWTEVGAGLMVRQRGGLRRAVPAPVAAQPLPDRSLRGGAAARHQRPAGDPRRPPRRRVRAEPRADSALHAHQPHRVRRARLPTSIGAG